MSRFPVTFQGENAETERVHEQSQTVREEVPDTSDPDVGVSLSNVATLLHQQVRMLQQVRRAQ